MQWSRAGIKAAARRGAARTSVKRCAAAQQTSNVQRPTLRPAGCVDPVTVREIDGTHVKIGPIEVFDGTPVVDIKSASTRADG